MRLFYSRCYSPLPALDNLRCLHAHAKFVRSYRVKVGFKNRSFGYLWWVDIHDLYTCICLSRTLPPTLGSIYRSAARNELKLHQFNQILVLWIFMKFIPSCVQYWTRAYFKWNCSMYVGSVSTQSKQTFLYMKHMMHTWDVLSCDRWSV